jgi:ATPase subunit of ABC transporter with duplicated ATPase domains
MNTISFYKLTKRYGPVLAVDDLSFDVPPGRVTGFLGPNGSGKTTTLIADILAAVQVVRPRLAAGAPTGPRFRTDNNRSVSAHRPKTPPKYRQLARRGHPGGYLLVLPPEAEYS